MWLKLTLVSERLSPFIEVYNGHTEESLIWKYPTGETRDDSNAPHKYLPHQATPPNDSNNTSAGYKFHLIN